MNLYLLSLGLVPPLINSVTAVLAWWHRRRLLVAGFGLAAVNGVILAMVVAGGRLPAWALLLSALLRSVVVGLIDASFWLNQVRGRRPRRWTP